jgi:hypothetical protein
LFLFVFLMIAILTRVRPNLNAVFICISPLTKDVESFSCTYESFVLLHLKCVSWLDYLFFFFCLTLKILYIFWLLIHGQRWKPPLKKLSDYFKICFSSRCVFSLREEPHILWSGNWHPNLKNTGDGEWLGSLGLCFCFTMSQL